MLLNINKIFSIIHSVLKFITASNEYLFHSRGFRIKRKGILIQINMNSAPVFSMNNLDLENFLPFRSTLF